MKSRILKYLVLSSALAFMNCGDDAAEAIANAIGDTGLESSASVVDSANSVDSTDPTSSAMANPVDSANSTNPIDSANMGSSASVNPEDPANPADSSNSADPATPTSSDVTDPATPTDPTSSASVEPVVVDPASSAAAPASSSSDDTEKVTSGSSIVPEKIESSSSVEVQVPTGIFLAPGTEEEKNQLEVEYKKDIGYGAKGNGILAYPKQLSTTQKHGIVIWGPGGGTEPGAYEGMIRRLASHGFVVFALDESPGSGDNAKKALDFLAKKNETQGDELFGKLDMNVAGCSGHSMGGLESEQAAIKDSRVQTAFLNNSGDLGHAAAASVSTSKSIAILYGEGGMERPNAVADYRNNGVKAPACLIKMRGGQGNECANDDWDRTTECGYGHGSGSWDGMAATVAWMRWHLGGEDFRKADFVGSSGKYIDGNIAGHQGQWKTECKNF
ncbi:MAG: alpha/beta hydrolase [Fibrobacter sp.]|nr:alpha/beta hydrolase [Fibrobacter sp.]